MSLGPIFWPFILLGFQKPNKGISYLKYPTSWSQDRRLVSGTCHQGCLADPWYWWNPWKKQKQLKQPIKEVFIDQQFTEHEELFGQLKFSIKLDWPRFPTHLISLQEKPSQGWALTYSDLNGSRHSFRFQQVLFRTGSWVWFDVSALTPSEISFCPR